MTYVWEEDHYKHNGYVIHSINGRSGGMDEHDRIYSSYMVENESLDGMHQAILNYCYLLSMHKPLGEPVSKRSVYIVWREKPIEQTKDNVNYVFFRANFYTSQAYHKPFSTVCRLEIEEEANRIKAGQ